jgi:hypothetical protein
MIVGVHLNALPIFDLHETGKLTTSFKWEKKHYYDFFGGTVGVTDFHVPVPASVNSF